MDSLFRMLLYHTCTVFSIISLFLLISPFFPPKILDAQIRALPSCIRVWYNTFIMNQILVEVAA